MLSLTQFSLKDIKNSVVEALGRLKIEDYLQEAEILICEAFEIDRVKIYTGDYKPSEKQLKKLSTWLEKRSQHIPLGYVINKAFFYGNEFYVDENVLIPRSETEVLVESVVKLFKDNKLSNKLIADVGTGCGNIAISLTKHLTSCKIMATDICPQAIGVAKKNIENFGLEANITLLKGDLFRALENYKGKIDIIVSNPPYISEVEMDALSKEVRCEPYKSLYGGKDGLNFYKRFFQEAASYLSKDGLMFLEIGYNQGKSMRVMCEASENFSFLQIKKDYRKLDRIICCRKN
ncbi:MAG: peptide chain release factor N(5)-glutamine methyltransferase [Candidatus Kappaea frigidicola]|nr:peptide chain release factor N(5)-glutamine methyltransferase [Candidatus Kappaea frigidicola]